jgi:hypothetical protein
VNSWLAGGRFREKSDNLSWRHREKSGRKYVFQTQIQGLFSMISLLRFHRLLTDEPISAQIGEKLLLAQHPATFSNLPIVVTTGNTRDGFPVFG